MTDLSQQQPPEEDAKLVQVRNLENHLKHSISFNVLIQTNKNLCWSCKRKVGLLGFACKCDYVFCGKHRYAEEHNCQFDYKQRQQEKLAKENPIVQKGKISKI